MSEAARGTGLKGMRGTWVSGQGKHDSKQRDVWWRLEGVDAYPGGHSIQDRKIRMGIGCTKIGVSQYQGGGYGRA